MNEATLTWDERALLGEGPLWDEREQCLHWVDGDARTLHTLWPATEKRASTVYDGQWETTVPSFGLAGNTFLAGVALQTLGNRIDCGHVGITNDLEAGAIVSREDGFDKISDRVFAEVG